MNTAFSINSRLRIFGVIFASVVLMALFAPIYVGYRKLKTYHKTNRQILELLQNPPSAKIVREEVEFVPVVLQNIPYGEETGVVVASRQIHIRGLPSIYNASILDCESKYLFIFRYDVFTPESPHRYHAQIGCAWLDQDFQQTEEEFVTLNVGKKEAEDPRLFRCGKTIHILFNSGDSFLRGVRKMYLGQLDPHTMKVSNVTVLDPYLSAIEKNWVPFEYIHEQNRPTVCFEYALAPRRLLTLVEDKLECIPIVSRDKFQDVLWPDAWGHPRGGTPAIHMDDHYLAFFHSSFRSPSNQQNWYVIGTYTFEDKPPFSITGVSYYPILFNGIYTSTPMHIGNPSLRCIFPGGFIVEKQANKELIHLVCGENDSTVKVVTLDNQALHKSLRPLNKKVNF